LIILICGYPVVGKTTVAHELAPLINAVVLSTDKIRKEFFAKPNYGEEERRTIYKIFNIDS
jgi:predicted kinase